MFRKRIKNSNKLYVEDILPMTRKQVESLPWQQRWIARRVKVVFGGEEYDYWKKKRFITGRLDKLERDLPKLNVEELKALKPRCIWLWGFSGCGKNLWIYKNFGMENVYSKSLTKWWSFYTGQSVVTFDNVASYSEESRLKNIVKAAKVQEHCLKWKGVQSPFYFQPRYKWIFITSVCPMDCIKKSKWYEDIRELFEEVPFDKVNDLLK